MDQESDDTQIPCQTPSWKNLSLSGAAGLLAELTKQTLQRLKKDWAHPRYRKWVIMVLTTAVGCVEYHQLNMGWYGLRQLDMRY